MRARGGIGRRAVRHGTPLDLTWERWELGDDGEHLTEAAFPNFVEALADAVAGALEQEEKEVLVLTDSSVDFYEDGAGEVARALDKRGVRRARVDAVCGSGLLRGPTFGSRLRAHASRGGGGVVVLVGGWNDVWHSTASEKALRAAARRFCAAAERWGGGGQRASSSDDDSASIDAAKPQKATPRRAAYSGLHCKP